MTPIAWMCLIAVGLLSVYVAGWAANLLDWWMVWVYGMVVTVAWAETGNREPGEYVEG